MSKVTVSFEVDILRLAALQAFLGGDIATTEAPKKKRAAAPAEEPDFSTDTEDAEEPDFTIEEEPASKKVDLKMIRERIKKVMDAGKSDKLGQLFAAYKVKNAAGIPENKYEKFYENLCKIKV